MKKLFAIFALTTLIFAGITSSVLAQNETTAAGQTDTTTQVAPATTTDAAAATATTEAEAPKSIHQQLKIKFIEGGAEFMTFILLTLIFGLALAIERIIYLSLSSTNVEKLMANIEEALNSGGIEAAKDVCRNTRGPIAAIFYQGLDRSDEGIEVVEKSVIAYGSVQMGLLEKGVSWITLFIALAPMLGFLGTVIGMIMAFDAIEIAGDISPTLVAGGIKVALITTVFGLIVAMILQVFYNLIISKIDGIVNGMEDASITLIDMLVKFNAKK